MNWLLQIFSVTLFSLRTLPGRLGSALTAAVGIAGVVAVLVSVLAIAEGFRKAMARSGTPDQAIVMRAGADTEMTSNFTREEVRLIRDAPGLGRFGDGPAASAELFVIVDLPKRSTGSEANVPLRGVEPAAFDIRGQVQLVQGRRFEPGKNEIVVGIGAARTFAGLDLGQAIRIGKNTWQIVGLFTAGGGVAESEIWTDTAVLQPAYQREEFQSVYVRLVSRESFNAFKDALTSNPQLKVKVLRLAEFYAEQSAVLSDFIHTLGYIIATLMAIGALFGALNTMYNAVAVRTREIATLRALGFGTGPVMISVLIESILLSFAGGVVGAGLSYLIFDGYKASTMNFQTFTQITFAFAVTPELLGQAIIWAVLLGLIGGLFPGWRAAHLPIAAGLREG